MKAQTLPAREKRHGIHYTPAGLAQAVAQRLVQECVVPIGRPLVAVDPACGDGALLSAFAAAAAERAISTCLVGADIDPDAIAITRRRLRGVANVHLSQRDFLLDNDLGGDLFAQTAGELPVDVFIANPPYVRTQVLGSSHAQELARRFGLRGRVDLAYAFCMAMVDALPPGGLFAFIVSNKFMTINAGGTLREFLRRKTEVLEVWDLGDSKLFSAAVLPCVIFGRRDRGGFQQGAPFRSIYSTRGAAPAEKCALECATVDELLLNFTRAKNGSQLAWREEVLEVRVGTLDPKPQAGTWVLSNAAVEGVQIQIRDSKARHFEHVLKIKVGIKTTADSVFIRNDWDALPHELRPEHELLWPVRMSTDVARWILPSRERLSYRTLYPFQNETKRRTPVDLTEYPGAQRYLQHHRAALERRKYVIDAGRHWWEPWVPHHPWVWRQARAVFPDISEHPIFGLDEPGVIANGTLYWMHAREESETEILRAACAIANSSFAIEYYDMLLGTRLYAGRRRWNTQHVGQLPFPGRDADVALLAGLHDMAVAATKHCGDLATVEAEIDRACRSAFSRA